MARSKRQEERSVDTSRGDPAAAKSSPGAADQGGEAQLFLESCLNSLSSHIAVVDPAGMILAVNNSWRAYAVANGADPDTVSEGANYLAVCDRAGGALEARPFAEGVRAVIAGERDDFALEYPCHGPGATNWFVGRVTPFAEPPPRRAVIAHENVTVRRLAEQRLEKSEREERQARLFLQIVLDLVPELISYVDSDGRFRFANGRYRDYFGIDPEAMIGMRAEDVLGEEAYRKIGPRHRAALAGEPQEHEPTITLPSGMEGQFNARYVPHVEEGDVKGFLAVVRDMTEREQMLRALEESATRLSLAVDATRVGHWDWDLRTNEVYFSPQWKRQLGYEDDELENRYENWEDRLHPDDQPRVLELLQQYIAGRRESFGLEFRLRHKDGGYRWIFTRADKQTDEAGRAVRLFGCHVDITDRKAMEAQLAHAQKMEAVGQLAGGVAHDFNNILQAVLGFSEFLLDRLEPETEEHGFASEIQRSAQRASTLTRQLLTFSRRQRLEPQQVDLNELVAGTMAMLERVLGPQVTVYFERSEEALLVYADPNQMEQVLLNLCLNARDAMPDGGEVVIRTHRRRVDVSRRPHTREAPPGEYVAFTVSDTGHGMDADARRRLFEPFFTTKDSSRGTGLGLAVCYGIVKQHEGVIKVESEPGRGTTMHVLLPVGAPRLRAAATQAESKPDALPPRSATVLLAEDDSRVRRLTGKILEDAGHRVILATSGAHALELGRRHLHELDLALLDVVMPEVSGVDVCTTLRRLRSDLPVILATGYAADLEEETPAACTDATVLHKPIERSRLLAAVRTALSPSRSDVDEGDSNTASD